MLPHFGLGTGVASASGRFRSALCACVVGCGFLPVWLGEPVRLPLIVLQQIDRDRTVLSTADALLQFSFMMFSILRHCA